MVARFNKGFCVNIPTCLRQYTYLLASIYLLFCVLLRQYTYFFSCALKVNRAIFWPQSVTRSLYSSMISSAFKNSMAVVHRFKNRFWLRCSSYRENQIGKISQDPRS